MAFWFLYGQDRKSGGKNSSGRSPDRHPRALIQDLQLSELQHDAALRIVDPFEEDRGHAIVTATVDMEHLACAELEVQHPHTRLNGLARTGPEGLRIGSQRAGGRFLEVAFYAGRGSGRRSGGARVFERAAAAGQRGLIA